MLCDVAIQWNSTFNMLDYVIAHRAAVEKITQQKNLRKYKLGDKEWDLLIELPHVCHY